MAIFKPYTKTTIDGVIREGKKLAISESSMAFKEVIDDKCVVTFNNVITKYMDAIKSYIVEIELSDSELYLYSQKPNKYCYDVYGTPELASSLLYINNMSSVTQFKKRKIKTFSNNILEIIKELMSLTEQDLINNRMTCGVD